MLLDGDRPDVVPGQEFVLFVLVEGLARHDGALRNSANAGLGLVLLGLLSLEGWLKVSDQGFFKGWIGVLGGHFDVFGNGEGGLEFFVEDDVVKLGVVNLAFLEVHLVDFFLGAEEVFLVDEVLFNDTEVAVEEIKGENTFAVSFVVLHAFDSHEGII